MRSSSARGVLAVVLAVLAVAGAAPLFASGQSQKATAPAAAPAVVLKFWGLGANGAVSNPGVQTDPVAIEIEKRLGVKLEFYPQETDEVFLTMLASGDIPDILVVNRKYAKQLIEGRLVADLEPLLTRPGSHVAKQTLTINYDRRYMSNGTGKLYFLTLKPGSEDDPSLVVAPWLRWDYYRELGYPAIVTVDDYLSVLAEMVKRHPTNEDGQTVYGLSPWFDWGMWSFTTPAYIRGVWQFGMLDYDMGNAMAPASTVTSENSSFWWTTELYNKANRTGLLDPDCFTQKFDTALQKARAHRVVGSAIGFQLSQGNSEFTAAGRPDMGYAPIAPALGTKAYWAGYVQPLGADSNLAIGSKTRYLDQTMRLVDFFWSEEGARLAWSGAPGSSYNAVSGRLVLKPEIIQARRNDPDFAVKTGVGRYGNLAGLPASAKDPNGQYLNLFQEPEVLAIDYTPLEKQVLEHYEVRSYKELLDKRVKTYLVDTSVILLTDQTPDDIKRIDDKITNYLLTNAPKAILAKTEAEFAQLKAEMIRDVKAMDFNASIEYWLKVAKNAKDAMSAMSE